MEEKHKILILKSLMFGYADIVVTETDAKFHDEQWYKQALEVKRCFKKMKPTPVNPNDRVLLDKVYQKFVSFDAEYFEDKKGAAYLCMITIMDYLINEKNDTSLKVKFGHYPFKHIRNELSQHELLKPIHFDTERYLTAILEKLNME